jgi:hypothetical protein
MMAPNLEVLGFPQHLGLLSEWVASGAKATNSGEAPLFFDLIYFGSFL